MIHELRRLAFGLRTFSSPKGLDVSSKLRQIPAGSQVYVYQSLIGKLTGPHKFMTITGETPVGQTGRGRRILRSTFVRPVLDSVLSPITTDDTETDILTNDTEAESKTKHRNLRTNDKRPDGMEILNAVKGEETNMHTTWKRRT